VELKDRLAGLARSLPPAQRVGIAVAAVVLIMAAIPFFRWVMTPSYTLLYGGLEDAEIAEVVTELEARSVPFELEGSRILVPQDRIHRVRADLAEAGVSGSPSVPGYELLDEQALGVSDFRQRVDLQRAVEGELSRTLAAMDAVDSANVRLVLPEDSLFTDQQRPATASVLLRPRRQLDDQQVQSVTLLVSSAVEGLDPDQITVADTAGNVLHAPGDGSTAGVGDANQRRTREFEQALGADLSSLLQRATGSPSSVVVRAALDFSETETQTETYDDEGVALREQTSEERYEGIAPQVGGIVGVDGGPVAGEGGEGTYERDDATREFGVGRTTTRTVQAPGTVEGLSVAVVVDENAVVTDNELQQLVTAAAGLDADRGDAVAISRVPAMELEEAPPADDGGLLDHIQTIVALASIVLIALGLFLMSRRRREPEEPEKVVPAQMRPTTPLEPAGHAEAPAPSPEELEPANRVRDEVAELVERQPEEIASLLRGWLADRRAGV
jgi:flagellar M-ring protein FliF